MMLLRLSDELVLPFGLLLQIALFVSISIFPLPSLINVRQLSRFATTSDGEFQPVRDVSLLFPLEHHGLAKVVCVRPA